MRNLCECGKALLEQSVSGGIEATKCVVKIGVWQVVDHPTLQPERGMIELSWLDSRAAETDSLEHWLSVEKAIHGFFHLGDTQKAEVYGGHLSPYPAAAGFFHILLAQRGFQTDCGGSLPMRLSSPATPSDTKTPERE
jgi:hypothetical protein